MNIANPPRLRETSGNAVTVDPAPFFPWWTAAGPGISLGVTEQAVSAYGLVLPDAAEICKPYTTAAVAGVLTTLELDLSIVAPQEVDTVVSGLMASKASVRLSNDADPRARSRTAIEGCLPYAFPRYAGVLITCGVTKDSSLKEQVEYFGSDMSPKGRQALATELGTEDGFREVMVRQLAVPLGLAVCQALRDQSELPRSVQSEIPVTFNLPQMRQRRADNVARRIGSILDGSLVHNAPYSCDGVEYLAGSSEAHDRVTVRRFRNPSV